MTNRIFRILRYLWIRRSPKSILDYYRKNGCQIGKDVYVKDPKHLLIDISRPSLVSIGNHVFLHRGLSIITHDYTSWVFAELYNDFIPSHGRVKIGNNVWFGEKCTVLKGVTIGNNCIIGYGSIVNKSIPANSVAVGIPAKVICTIEEYYEKRKKKYTEETIDYAISIKEHFNREPTIDDFTDDYPCFVDGSNVDNYPMMLYSRVLQDKHFEGWKQKHKAVFNGFDEFLGEVNKRTIR
jgi:acetyltransferase-like isoleucine patch superfamily enzyme